MAENVLHKERKKYEKKIHCQNQNEKQQSVEIQTFKDKWNKLETY